MTSDNSINIERLADIAMLSLTEEEKQKLTADAKKLISFAEKIKDFEYDEVKYGKRGPKNVLRADKPSPCTNRESLLSGCVSTAGGFIEVPAVIGGEE